MSRFARVLATTSMAVLVVVLSIDPATAHASPPRAPATPTEQVYTVKPGDFLGGIAEKLHVPLSELLAANGLTKDSVIHPGDKLIVPAVASGQVYTVVPGDFLSRIASTLDVALADLLSLNGLTKSSVIHPGMLLQIPAGGALPPTVAPTAPPASTLVYTVKPGDYFKRIASKLGVSVDSLLAVNGLQLTSVIYAGTQLKVPVGGSLPEPGASPPADNSVSAKVKVMLDFAAAQIGEPWVFLGAGPDSWDCSGLTMRAYAAIGITLPHYSVAQAKYGRAINWRAEPIRAGDLVFLETSTGSGIISHVGIASSATTWIQAPRGGEFVRSGSIPLQRVVAVRRLVSDG
ncbi:MAG: LysM peptidoglycan-binding domain-containing protein [Actinobacteria bacterium]|nr:LysM peptidoglycan-binding domain-containing protein [Actinomycetota bacterium]